MVKPASSAETSVPDVWLISDDDDVDYPDANDQLASKDSNKPVAEEEDDGAVDDEDEAEENAILISVVGGNERFNNDLTPEEEQNLLASLTAPAYVATRGTWGRVYQLWATYRGQPSLNDTPLHVFTVNTAKFLVQARKQDGSDYAPGSLDCAFSAICSLWAAAHPDAKLVNGWTDQRLAGTVRLLRAKQAQLLRNGTPLPKKASEIPDDVIEKMFKLPQMQPDHPVGLMHRLVLLFNFCLGRRRSWYHRLPLRPFLGDPSVDQRTGLRYYCIGYYVNPHTGLLECNAPELRWDKNHKPTVQALQFPNKFCIKLWENASRPDLCPIRLIELYKKHWIPTADHFFCRPNKKMRALPISLTVLSGLPFLISTLATGPIWVYKGRMGVDAISAVIREAAIAAGMDPAGKYTCHSFRRTFITKLFEAGFSAEEIKQITGHASDIVHSYRGGQNHQTSLRAAQAVTKLQSGPPIRSSAELIAAVIAAINEQHALVLELMPTVTTAVRKLKDAKGEAAAPTAASQPVAPNVAPAKGPAPAPQAPPPKAPAPEVSGPVQEAKTQRGKRGRSAKPAARLNL